jgi:hypothetical protein
MEMDQFIMDSLKMIFLMETEKSSTLIKIDMWDNCFKVKNMAEENIIFLKHLYLRDNGREIKKLKVFLSYLMAMNSTGSCGIYNYKNGDIY